MSDFFVTDKGNEGRQRISCSTNHFMRLLTWFGRVQQAIVTGVQGFGKASVLLQNMSSCIHKLNLLWSLLSEPCCNVNV